MNFILPGTATPAIIDLEIVLLQPSYLPTIS